MTNEYGLQAVHETELKMLKELDSLCRKHNIEYMLDAGTLIGAVREKGFIPWDDDIDISMTRKNWEKFKEVVKTDLPESFEFLQPMDLARNNRFYDYIYRLIYLPSKRHTEDDKSQYFGEKLNHFWIDIFILDNVPDGAIASAWTSFMQKVIYALSMGYKKSDFRDCSRLQSFVLSVPGFFGRAIPMTKLCTWKEKFSAKDAGKTTKACIVTNYPPNWAGLKIRKEWIKDIIYLPFEDTELPAPCGFHEVLTVGYGDYMKRPPESERAPKHDTGEGYIA